ncbi:50S ribosomal protein L1 [Echinococcus multilocularis]|uniref:50S ribosomal protein L1 n=1 Tax=Echinococcus multilocularis TaxID=6211 RepID=A0A087VWR3_ECHMU|nr:50S ribosomal protein L1 [Echinococcus multilocularis]
MDGYSRRGSHFPVAGFSGVMSLNLGCRFRYLLAFRSLHTSTILPKGNSQRYRVKSGVGSTGSKATSRRESVANMRAASSRARWEAEAAAEARVRDLHPLPTLNVFFAERFERRRWPLRDAVAMLREAAVPEMFNCLENPLYAKATLNQRTKKANKFVSKLETSTILPNQLNFLPKRRIIVLTNDAAVADECVKQWGAVAAGGADIVGRLEVGAFHWDEYDDVVAHPDFTEALHKVRKILHNRMPTVKNGRMGEDVIELLKAQQICVLLSSVPVEGVPEINEIQMVLGQLSWDDSRLEENLHCYLKAIDAAKSTRINGDLLERVEVFCPPCGEAFQLAEIHASGGANHNTVEESDDEEEERDSA